jgi:hypothetical protein|tara:strand:+ start:605 stop:817 length:213 start_codon:yes stop_codon:yes gene_type:complete
MYNNDDIIKYQSTMIGHMKDQDAKDKAAGIITMRNYSGDAIVGTTVNINDTTKIAKLKAEGYKQEDTQYV